MFFRYSRAYCGRHVVVIGDRWWALCLSCAELWLPSRSQLLSAFFNVLSSSCVTLKSRLDYVMTSANKFILSTIPAKIVSMGEIDFNFTSTSVLTRNLRSIVHVRWAFLLIFIFFWYGSNVWRRFVARWGVIEMLVMFVKWRTCMEAIQRKMSRDRNITYMLGYYVT